MNADQLGRTIELVRQMCGASKITAGTILVAVWLLGYRKVAEPVDLPSGVMPGVVPGVVPCAEEMPPATPTVDEIFRGG